MTSSPGVVPSNTEQGWLCNQLRHCGSDRSVNSEFRSWKVLQFLPCPLLDRLFCGKPDAMLKGSPAVPKRGLHGERPRSPINRHVSEPSWRWILQPQLSLRWPQLCWHLHCNFMGLDQNHQLGHSSTPNCRNLWDLYCCSRSQSFELHSNRWLIHFLSSLSYCSFRVPHPQQEQTKMW